MSEKDRKKEEVERRDSIAGFEDLLGEGTFNADASSPEDDSEESFLEVDDRQAEEMRQIFGASFPQYLQPVEEVLEQIFSGQGEADSIDTLLGIIDSLHTATQRMNLPNIYGLLTRLSERIQLIDKKLKKPIEDDVKKGIIAEIQNLKNEANKMAGIETAQTETEQKVEQKTIRSALKDQEGIGELVIKRLNMAGLVTVDQIQMGQPDEIAAVSGLDIDIVQRVIKLLAEDGQESPKRPPKKSTPTGPKKKQRKSPVKSKVDSLHEKVIELIQQEASERSSIEQLRVDIDELRALISSYRETMKRLTFASKEKDKTIRKLEKQVKKQTVVLGELKSQRREHERKCASLKESINQKEIRLKALNKKQKSLEQQSDTLSYDVESLVSSLGQINRTVRR